ncbi:MAG: ABC transporter ATP-binding protein [Clostridiales Family XIII bacterium]|jgi:ABC-2 type transport system ATP-binding protein|nr:ABC transporter ATP-binding protein [Clostridiales Family XIII bacterium]
MSSEIVIDKLYKSYGRSPALKDVTLTIGPGIFGLLGRNGAGKTTLLRILATLLPKTAGAVTVCGTDISRAKDIRPMIGYLPQEFSFYPGMNVYEALDYLGLLSGMGGASRAERIPEVLERVNLQGERNKRIRALSGGMKRRFGMAQAILHDPAVLIVDEPTTGLDPVERVRFRNMLKDTAGERIVILSTHIVEDVEKLCDHLAVLDHGAVVFSGSVPDFTAGAGTLEDAYMQIIGEVS